MTALVRAAEAFAWAAHAGQKRKYCGSPYICHPAHVVGLLTQAGVADEEVLAAAWLHDVVEDNDHVENIDIRMLFGHRVADLVAEVTNVSTREDGNRKIRKEIDRQHLAKASEGGKTLKLADMLSNSESIIKNDPGFAKVYMQEKSDLLEVLQGGNDKLFVAAKKVVDDYFNRSERKSAA